MHVSHMQSEIADTCNMNLSQDSLMMIIFLKTAEFSIESFRMIRNMCF